MLINIISIAFYYYSAVLNLEHYNFCFRLSMLTHDTSQENPSPYIRLINTQVFYFYQCCHLRELDDQVKRIIATLRLKVGNFVFNLINRKRRLGTVGYVIKIDIVEIYFTIFSGVLMTKMLYCCKKCITFKFRSCG